MEKKSPFLLRHLSAVTFVGIYILLVINHLVSDSFSFNDQLGLIIVILPFILIGLALDFILSRNRTMKLWNRILIQLLPTGVFIIYIISSIYLLLDKTPTELFNSMIWLFVALPFFMASYQRDTFQRRFKPSIIGTVVLTVVYLFLATQTQSLDQKNGAILYLVSYFCMFYTASGITKLPYLGMLLGILNAALLLFLRYVPVTQDAKQNGWDSDILRNFESLILATLVFSIIIRIWEAVKAKEVHSNSEQEISHT